MDALTRSAALFNAGRFRAAARALEGLSAGACGPDAFFLRGMARWSAGRRHEGLLDLREALKRCPGAVEWRLSLAGLLRQAGRGSEARRQCEEVLRRRPHLAQAWLLLANLEEDAGSPEKELSCLRKAAALGGPGGREARQRLLSRNDEASLMRAIRAAPADPDLRFRIAVLLGDRGLWARAVAHLRAAERDKKLAVEALRRQAVLWRRAGKPGRAWTALSKALSRSRGDATLHREAAGLLLTLGRRSEARAHYLAAARGGALSGEETLGLEESLGLNRRAAATAAALVAAHAGDPALRLRAARAFQALGETQEALTHCRAAAKLEPRRPEISLLLAELLQMAGRSVEALRWAKAALRSGAGPAAASLAAGLSEARGDYGSAERFWAACAPPRSFLERARLRLWRGKIAEAERLARQALDAGFRGSAPWRILGAASVLAGRPLKALPFLSRALKLEPHDAEALCWRGEALRVAGRRREAAESLALSRDLSINPIGALLNELLLRGGERPEIVRRFQEDAGLPANCRLEDALLKLGGNRSIESTILSGGALLPFRFRSGKESLLELQRSLAWAAPAEVLKRFDAVMRRRPSWGQAYTHRAEVNLWLGRYKDAERDFLAAWRVDQKLRWVKFGLCAVNLMRGRLGEARRYLDMALNDGGLPFSQWVWHGELLRREGDPRGAIRELEKAVALYPRRPAAWLNLALAHGALGRERRMRKIFDFLFESARPLFLEAASSLGVDLELNEPSPSLIPRLLERALLLMRGNRSSWMNTYLDRSGRLRSYQFIVGTR
jgi:tetratricopeptide (TPR) repeat protein